MGSMPLQTVASAGYPFTECEADHCPELEIYLSVRSVCMLHCCRSPGLGCCHVPCCLLIVHTSTSVGLSHSSKQTVSHRSSIYLGLHLKGIPFWVFHRWHPGHYCPGCTWTTHSIHYSYPWGRFTCLKRLANSQTNKTRGLRSWELPAWGEVVDISTQRKISLWGFLKKTYVDY